MSDFKTTHDLVFESADWYAENIKLFRIGTCHGQWGSTKDSYFILSVINDSPGNGHLTDVFELFERSCKRDDRNLLVLDIFNEKFYLHLISKRGFIPLDTKGDNVIKVFNTRLYKLLKKNGNEMLHAGTLTTV